MRQGNKGSLRSRYLVKVSSLWYFMGNRKRVILRETEVMSMLKGIILAIIMALCLIRFGFSAECIRNLIFSGCLLYLSLTDLKTYRIPNGCLMVAVSAWVAEALFSNRELSVLAARVLSAAVLGGSILLLSLPVEKILKKQCLGYGDMKLFAVIGLYLGMTAALFAIILSCIFGLLLAMTKIIFQKKQPDYFSFGPCIALASWIMLMYGQPLVGWYLNLNF